MAKPPFEKGRASQNSRLSTDVKLVRSTREEFHVVSFFFLFFRFFDVTLRLDRFEEFNYEQLDILRIFNDILKGGCSSLENQTISITRD